MNAFAAVLFFTIWAIVALLGYNLFLSKKNEKKSKMIFLIFLFFLIVVQLRVALTISHDFISPDEEILIQNIQAFVSTNDIFDNHSSGPAFVFFMFWLSETTGFEINETIGFSAFLFPLMAMLLALILLKGFFGKIISEKAFWLCLLSPLFVWPLLEIRPEIFGITIFFGILLLLKKFFDTGKNNYCIAAAAIAICLGPLHLFSFFLAIILFATAYLLARIQNKKTGLLFPIIILTVISFFFLFSLFSIIWDIHFTIRDSIGLGGRSTELAYGLLLRLHTIGLFKISVFLLVPTILAVAFLTVLSFVAGNKRDFLSKKMTELLASNTAAKIIAVLILLAFASQFAIQWEDINYFYGNPLVFVLMQATTIIIVFLALIQFNGEKQKILKNTALASAIIGLFFSITVIAAVSLIVKSGFNNFAIRIIPFLFPLAAGIAIPKLETKKIAVVLLLLLFPLSLIATTRDPGFIARIPFHEKTEIAGSANAERFTDNFAEQLKGKTIIPINQITGQQMRDNNVDRIFQNKAIIIGIKG